jgi:DNA-binding response OmpR family regulator
VIEALVKSIRRKLGDRASAIETVRGLGYRFVAHP